MKKNFSRIFSGLLLLLTLFLCSSTLLSCANEKVTNLYVYNWGEYMALGKEDSEDILELFETWYNATHDDKVNVVYSIFSCNEELYAKMRNGSAQIDLIIPSDYMIARMIAEDMLEPLNFDNIPAYDGIDAQFRDPEGKGEGPIYDPYCLYSVPYTFGLVGLVYNNNLVDESDIFDEDGNVIASWNLLWDEKYTGSILTFNNYRDAFGISQYILSDEKGLTGDDNYINTNDKSRWDEVYEKTLAQHPYVQAYVMDEIYNKMESGAAALAPYYAGDFYTMQDATLDENDESFLQFVYPTEGTNIFVDAMCIPKGSTHKELAEVFINFLISTDVEIEGESYNIAKENAEYICYACPITEVMNDEDYDYFEDEILYPDTAEMKTYYFNHLDNETLDYANALWEKLKVESSPSTGIYVWAGVIVGSIVAFLIFITVRKQKRSKYY